jgi:membrane protein
MNATVLKQTWQAFNEDKVLRLASAVAYATIFSLAPLLIVLIAIGGALLGAQNGGHAHHVVENALLDQIRARAGAGAADTVRDLVTASFDKPRASLFAQIAGWVTFAIGATSLFGALQDALNTIWNVEAVKGGWRRMLRDRLAAGGTLLLLGLLLVGSLALSGAVAFAHPGPAAGAGSFALNALLLTLVFALLYKVLPDVDLAWRDVWLGAFVTAILFVVGQEAISLYLRVAGVASAYGASGSILVALIWIYYSAAVLLLGAEFTKVSARNPKTSAPARLRRSEDVERGVDPRAPAGRAQAI